MIEKLKSLKNHQGFMKYFKNTSWLMGEKVIRMVVGLFIGVWVARYLGPEQFGLFSYAQSFVGLFIAISTLGLDAIVMRELIKNESRSAEIIGTAFWMKFFGAFAVLLVLAIAVNFTSNDTYTNTLVFIIASATIFQSFNVVDFYFQSKVMSKYVVYANMITLFISSIIKIVLLLNEAPLIAFVWVVLFDNVILACGLIFFFLKNSKFKIQNLKFNKLLAVDLLRDSWPLMFSTFIVSIYSQLDQVMLKNMVDSTEVGQYAAAMRLNSVFAFLPGVILASITPAIVSAKQKSEALFLNRLQSLYDLIVLYGIIAVIFILFFADYIIGITFGVEYNESALILKIVVFSNIFAYLGAASSRWYINSGFEKKILYRNLFGVIFNIAGNIILIPYYGAVGAAITTILAQVSANFIFDYFDKKTRIVFTQKRDALMLRTVYTNLWRQISGRK